MLNIGNGSRPGFLKVGQINGGGGEAIVNFNHDDLSFTLANGVTPVLLSGSVQVYHRGTGRTRLRGNHQYLGPTLVEQGTLILSDGAILSTPDRVLNIGEIDQQTGRLEMETEARATVDIVRVGRAGGSRGELKISGFGGGDTELRTIRTMIIGGGGEADVDLGETALLVAGLGAIVGRSGPGDGRVSMGDGARWLIEDGGLTIGEFGRGEVIVGNGAVLEILDGGQPGTVLIGAEPNGDGVLRIGNGVSAGTLLAASVIGGPGVAGLAFEHQQAGYEFLADGNPIGLGGAMNVVHGGSGSTRLFGSHSVDGDLLAALGGTFILNGQFDFNSFSAAFGGRLAGKGTLSGPETIQPASRLAPGDGIGLMTIEGNLIFAELATLEMELADTDPQSSLNARLTVNGNLILNGQLEVIGRPGFGPGRYRLINYTGMLDDQGLEIISLPPGLLISEASIDTSIPGQVDLVVGGVVEDGLFVDRFEAP